MSRCWHRWEWVFVGNSDAPDAFVRACWKCGQEKR